MWIRKQNKQESTTLGTLGSHSFPQRTKQPTLQAQEYMSDPCAHSLAHWRALTQLGSAMQLEECQVQGNHAMFSTTIAITFLSAAAHAVGTSRFHKDTTINSRALMAFKLIMICFWGQKYHTQPSSPTTQTHIYTKDLGHLWRTLPTPMVGSKPIRPCHCD